MKSGNKEIGFGKQTIAQVFEEWYTVPSYQRHYVWESDNVNDMLDDFASNYIEHAKEEYFLGSYIIQSKDNNNDLLDGQQRITTLFLLFAFLRDYADSSCDVKETCVNLIFQKANKIKQIPERIRLSYEIRGNVKKFIEEYLMTPGSITQHWDEIVKKANIQSEIYGRRYTYALLMLLEYKYKDKSEWKDFGTTSIEHILPQNPKATSQWVKDFNEEQRDYYTHRIGNLCLIGRRKNSSLGNLDYQEKLKRYFEKNIGSFASSQKIYKTYPNAWTPDTVQENQERVIKDLMEIFGINDSCSNTDHQSYIEQQNTNHPSYMEQQKAVYPNAYKPWTEIDDNKLVTLYKEGKSVNELMNIFLRNRGAIKSRLSKLTGIDFDK